MAPQRLLGKHQRSVHGHLEETARGLDQAHGRLRVQLPKLSRQTGGPWLVVSHHAILNADSHVGEANSQRQERQQRTPRWVPEGATAAPPSTTALAVSSGAAHIDAAILTVPVNAPSFPRAPWVRLAILLGAAFFLIAALLRIAGTPGWWAGGRALEVVLLALAATLTRRFGFPLPGRGVASFVLGVALLGLLLDGWPTAILTATAGMLAGDLLFRRLRLEDAASNAAHLCFGTGLTGLAYQALGGVAGDAALGTANLGPLTVGVLLLTLVVNSTFYLDLSQGPRAPWVDARLTVRWGLAVYAASAAPALGWGGLVAGRPPAGGGGAGGGVGGRPVDRRVGARRVRRLGCRGARLGGTGRGAPAGGGRRVRKSPAGRGPHWHVRRDPCGRPRGPTAFCPAPGGRAGGPCQYRAELRANPGRRRPPGPLGRNRPRALRRRYRRPHGCGRHQIARA